jgi:hypothetical protein
METFTCRFDGKKINMEILPSNHPGNGKTLLKGEMNK